MLQTAIGEAQSRLLPVTDKQIMAGMGLLAKHATNFNISIDAKGLTESYRLMCSAMPGDLFERGLVEALKSSTDTFRLPMPGQVWKIVQAEYDKRKRELGRLETALKFGRFDTPVPIEERVKAEDLDALMEKTRSALRRVA